MVPRRVPTQKRSRETVDAVFEAAIRAARARRRGRGEREPRRRGGGREHRVGSVYQYFPSKEMLLSSLIARFMRRRFEAIMQMIRDVEEEERRTGRLVPLETIMTRLVRRRREIGRPQQVAVAAIELDEERAGRVVK